MQNKLKQFTATCAAFLLGSAALFGQSQPQDEQRMSWKSEATLNGEEITLTITGKPLGDWHTYALNDEYSATEISFQELVGCERVGEPYAITQPEKDEYGSLVFNGPFQFGQKFKLTGGTPPFAWKISGMVTWISCRGTECASPEDWEFVQEGEIKPLQSDNKNVSMKNNNVLQADNQEVDTESNKNEHLTPISDPEDDNLQENPEEQASETIIQASDEATESTENGHDEGLWSLIIEAILWGFAMILTPCVFPMIPMTVSYFLKNSGSQSTGRFHAIMYGVFIVLLYTVPISLIIGATWIIGGEAVTADIFNWLATHWLPNIIFFVVFLVFAASFFGAFEITLPSKLVNKSDAKSDKKGLVGVFFMALTLVLVSFSCTGPIVGSVLIKSTQGEFWAPMLTMLAFSVAFALGFTFFAIFPSILKNGPWMNSVKVVFGFIELAFGLKFLSVADQTYHWHLLDREIYLALWIVIFSLLGLYLLGKIRFKHDEKPEYIGITRLGLSIATFAFVVYLIPGMWGAPLKGISGYLPPLETQDFILSKYQQTLPQAQEENAGKSKYDLKMPLGLNGYFTLEEAFEAAQKEGKPVFVDITGHGCVNCREMEQRVWSAPEVLNLLSSRFILVALYTDDKTSLKEEDWITTDNGKVLKDLGRANSYIVRSRFGVNAQPNYVILDADGKQISPVRGYNLSVQGFVDFLNSGLETFEKK